MMKVLFCVRHNFYKDKGGVYVQIMNTIKQLEKLDVKCDITGTPSKINYNLYDIIHLTDLTWVYDNLVYIKKIKEQQFKGKIVLSTVYWPFDDYASKGAPFFQRIIYKILGINGFEFFKALAKFLVKRNTIYLKGIFNTYTKNQISIVNFSDLLIPNSEMEMQAIKARLKIDNKAYKVAYNAINIDVFDKIIEKSKPIEKDEGLITFVARIDARKNQYAFLKAIYNTPYKICFIGNPGPNSKKYYEKLKNLATQRGNVDFISQISQEDVFKHMLKAKVNIMTSWIETPGLASLEAAYAECNIVVTDKGSVKEYFESYAYYCEPDNLASIKKAVELAIISPFPYALKQKIKQEYTWNKTAQDTFIAYNYILNNPS